MSGLKAKHRRMRLLNEKGVPTQTEVREQLGSPLAEVFFDSLDERCRELMGLKPVMSGPGPRTWMAPSDYLLGLVRLTPPLTSRQLRAENHKSILDLGEQCVLKFQNEMRIETVNTITDMVQTMRRQAREKLLEAVKNARKEEELKRAESKERLIEAFTLQMENEITSVKRSMVRQMATTIQLERAEVQEFMDDKMQTAMNSKTMELTSYYEEEIVRRDIEQLDEFIQFLQYVKEETTDLLVELQLHHIKDLIRLRYEMESDSMSNMAYAISEERKKCQTQKYDLEQSFKGHIAELKSTIEEKLLNMQTLGDKTLLLNEELHEWEERLRFIVNEFQRYINYFMRAVPGQAGFILNIENLLDLEKKLFTDLDQLPEEIPELLEEKKEEQEKIVLEEEKETERKFSAWAPRSTSKKLIKQLLNTLLCEIEKTSTEMTSTEIVTDILRSIYERESSYKLLSESEASLLEQVKRAARCDSMAIPIDELSQIIIVRNIIDGIIAHVESNAEVKRLSREESEHSEGIDLHEKENIPLKGEKHARKKKRQRGKNLDKSASEKERHSREQESFSKQGSAEDMSSTKEEDMSTEEASSEKEQLARQKATASSKDGLQTDEENKALTEEKQIERRKTSVSSKDEPQTDKEDGMPLTEKQRLSIKKKKHRDRRSKEDRFSKSESLSEDEDMLSTEQRKHKKKKPKKRYLPHEKDKALTEKEGEMEEESEEEEGEEEEDEEDEEHEDIFLSEEGRLSRKKKRLSKASSRSTKGMSLTEQEQHSREKELNSSHESLILDEEDDTILNKEQLAREQERLSKYISEAEMQDLSPKEKENLLSLKKRLNELKIHCDSKSTIEVEIFQEGQRSSSKRSQDIPDMVGEDDEEAAPEVEESEPQDERVTKLLNILKEHHSLTHLFIHFGSTIPNKQT